MMISSKLLFLYLLFAVALQAQYLKFLVDDGNSVCLDGSPSAYYLFNGDKDNVILYFQGGGWCGASTLSQTQQSCYERSFTSLGSSKDLPDSLQYSSGILSDSSSNYFKNWTKVFMISCDGSGYQGSRVDPVQYKGKKLYFRGQDSVIARLKSLQKEIGIYSKVKNLMISGGSAGGLAVYLWTNYIKANTKASNVWSVPDSGIFLNEKDKIGEYSYEKSFINLMKLSNSERSPPVPECVAKYKNQPYKCLFAENIYQFIKVPIFNIQSLYDTWAITHILGLSCPVISDLSNCSIKDITTIQEYHKKTYDLLNKIAGKQGNGGWAPVCANHCYIQYSSYDSDKFRIPQNSIYSANLSLKKWIFKEDDQFNYNHVEVGKWPDNTPCSKNTPNTDKMIQS